MNYIPESKLCNLTSNCRFYICFYVRNDSLFGANEENLHSVSLLSLIYRMLHIVIRLRIVLKGTRYVFPSNSKLKGNKAFLF